MTSGASPGARSSDDQPSSARAAARAKRIASVAEPRSARDAGHTGTLADRAGLSSSRAKRRAGRSSDSAKSPVDDDRAAADARIAALRQRIDALNAQLARGIQKRAQLALRIGAWKQRNNLPAADPRREREMLERVLSSAGPGLEREQLARIFRTLFRESRALVVKARKASTR
jgi:chorismate mutase